MIPSCNHRNFNVNRGPNSCNLVRTGIFDASSETCVGNVVVSSDTSLEFFFEEGFVVDSFFVPFSVDWNIYR